MTATLALKKPNKTEQKLILENAVKEYAMARPVKKEIDKTVKACTDIFKDCGLTVIKGKEFTVVRKETMASSFDSEAFKAKFGEEVYKSFMKVGPRVEFVVVPNNS